MRLTGALSCEWVVYFRCDRPTQEELSEKMEITAQYLSYVEGATRTPSFDVIIAASNVLNVSPADLFTETLKLTPSTKHKEIALRISQLTRDLSKDDQERILKIVSACVQINRAPRAKG